MKRLSTYLTFWIWSTVVFSTDTIWFEKRLRIFDNSVNAIAQDAENRIWLGSQKGLFRYDGYKMTEFYSIKVDTLSINNNWVESIFRDSKNNLWIGTFKGLMVWEPSLNGFLSVNLTPSSAESISYKVRKIFEDSSGNLWVATNKGLFKKENGQQLFNEYFLGYELKQREQYEIREVVELDNDRLLISTLTEVLVISLSDETSNRTLLKIEEVRAALFDDQSRQLWLGNHSDQIPLLSYNIDNGAIEYHQFEGIETNSVRKIRQFNNKLLIGTLDGLILYDPKTKENHKYLPHTSVYDIFIDSINGLWISTYSDGIYYYHVEANKFDHLYENYVVSNRGNYQEKKRKEIINAIVEINNNIWYGTEYGIKTHPAFSPETFEYPLENNRSQKLVNSRVKCLAYNNKEKLFIGTHNGLSVLNIKDQTIENLKLTDNAEIQDWNQIWDIVLDDDVTWLGTHGGGVFALENGEMNQYYDHFNASANQVHSLLKDGDVLWVGSNAGLSAINLSSRDFKKFRGNKNYLFDTLNIASLIKGQSGKLWLGTLRNGLVYFDPQSLDHLEINRLNSSIHNDIKSMVIDPDSAIWISTNKSAIYKVAVKSSQVTNIKDFEISEFIVKQDFDEPTYTLNASLLSSQKQIYLGTNQGVIRFNPKSLTNELKHPEVKISDIKINQASLTETPELLQRYGPVETIQHLELSHDQSVLSFEFACIDFNQHDEYYYAMFMEGIDKQWEIIDKKREVNFSYLPPGDYTLKLKASNNYQSWGDASSSLNITIAPPFYKAPEAYLVYMATIMLLLYLFYYYSSQWHQLKTKLEIEQINKEKEHEIHEHKSNFFLSIAHELKVPLSLILTPLQELLKEKASGVGSKNRLIAINRNTKKIERLINQMVEVRKIETSVGNIAVYELDIASFVKDLSKNFHTLARIKSIDFDVIIDQNLPRIWFDPYKIETVISNLLSNSFKYTNEHGQVNINVSLSNTEHKEVVKISVEDSGAGIPEDDIPFLFQRFENVSQKNRGMSLGDGIGLDLAKKIVDLHHGQIKVKSIPKNANSSGLTRFTVELLLGNEHFDPEVIRSGEPEKEIDTLSEFDESQYATVESNSVASEKLHSVVVANKKKDLGDQISEQIGSSYQLYKTEDGLETWKLVLDLLPSLVICHSDLPTINGLDLTKRIKLDERSCHIPVILIADKEVHESLADFVIDPFFDYKHLSSKVNLLIGQTDRIRNQIEKLTMIKPEVLTSYDEVMMDNMVEYLDNNLSDVNLSVQKLSGEIGISRTHLYRKIKELMNMSPNKFIRTYRIRKAAQLLAQEKHNISDVRIKVGFSDVDYFRSCFKKEFGMTPSDFINEHRIKNR